MKNIKCLFGSGEQIMGECKMIYIHWPGYYPTDESYCKALIALCPNMTQELREILEKKGGCMAIELKLGNGMVRSFDVSEESCRPFGFLSGQRAKSPLGEIIIFLGVSEALYKGDVIWYKGESGAYKYFSTAPYESKNLRNHGFILIE